MAARKIPREWHNGFIVPVLKNTEQKRTSERKREWYTRGCNRSENELKLVGCIIITLNGITRYIGDEDEIKQKAEEVNRV